MRPTRFFSDKQEKAVAKALGGKQTANSGATDFIKGDIHLSEWLIECKTTCSEKSSFSIKKAWLEKNREEAFEMGKHNNALCFDFGDNGTRYYVIDEKTFKQLIEQERED